MQVLTHDQFSSPTKHLNVPFFEASHRQLATDLAAWMRTQKVDEANDRAACRDWVGRLGAAGWLRYCVPEAFGGALPALSSRALVILREGLAYHSPLADFAFAMQGLGSGPITLSGNAAMQAQWLPRVARGEAIAAFALSEPDAGSDVAAMQTIATNATDTGHIGNLGGKSAFLDAAQASGAAATSLGHPPGAAWSINGVKTWISNGGIADFYTTFVKTDPLAGARGISALVVPAPSAGLDDSAHIQTLSPHPLATLVFTNCRVSDANRLGEVNLGFKLAMRTLDVFRASVAAAALGMARRALDEASAYAQARRMFGQTLADFQMTQAKLGDMATLIDGAALLTYRAAWMRDCALEGADEAADPTTQSLHSARDYTRAAAMAKLSATENAQKVIDMAQQLHGGQGVVVGSKIEALYRDIRALRIYEGASEVQQLIIGKAVLAAG